ncbi:CSEP0120 putative effector protein [Blumeria hordei DH14]|uniref:CSEP0120 putative effector protein n=1 Tax=Blumeria graminis f. sp. hordei (strain DH14) TaxID=546991 RepID=N1JGC3_BLUG1|nr:CSEP0120 putative effector protein [Blumeria hordei DH14]
MKFFSVATVVALAGLLPLLPTVYGEGYYKCPSTKTFGESDIMEYEHLASPDNNDSSHPEVPAGQTCSSYLFSGDSFDIGMKFYLFQIIGKTPKYRLFEFTSDSWTKCRFRKQN